MMLHTALNLTVLFQFIPESQRDSATEPSGCEERETLGTKDKDIHQPQRRLRIFTLRTRFNAQPR